MGKIIDFLVNEPQPLEKVQLDIRQQSILYTMGLRYTLEEMFDFI